MQVKENVSYTLFKKSPYKLFVEYFVTFQQRISWFTDCLLDIYVYIVKY